MRRTLKDSFYNMQKANRKKRLAQITDKAYLAFEIGFVSNLTRTEVRVFFVVF